MYLVDDRLTEPLYKAIIAARDEGLDLDKPTVRQEVIDRVIDSTIAALEAATPGR